MDESEFKINKISISAAAESFKNSIFDEFQTKERKGTFCLKIHLGCDSKISSPKEMRLEAAAAAAVEAATVAAVVALELDKERK